MICLDAVFLGSSQTFLGVLLTLFVLCIFYEGRNKVSSDDDIINDEIGGNNFLSRIIHREISRIRLNFKEASDALDEQKKQLGNDKNVKLLMKLIDSNEAKNSELKEKAKAIVFGYKFDISQISFSWISKENEFLEDIETSNEQFRAPFYCFLFGILLFCIDEIWTSFSGDSEFAQKIHLLLSLFVLYASIISFGYWVFIWSGNRRKNGNVKTNRWLINGWVDKITKFSWLIAGIIIIAIYWTFLCLLSNTKGRLSFFEICIEDFTFFISLSAFILPFVLGFIRYWQCIVRGRYSYLHILGHFLAITIYSIGISVGLTSFPVFDALHNDFLLKISNTELVKEIAILFVLVNGLLFPFLFPLTSGMIVARRTSRKIKDAIERITHLKEQFEFDAKNIFEEKGKSDLE